MVHVWKENTKSEKFLVPDIAKALGRSEGSVTGYFTNRGISTKKGLTVEQVYEYVNYVIFGPGSREGEYTGIHWDRVARLRELLENRYHVIIEEAEDYESKPEVEAEENE